MSAEFILMTFEVLTNTGFSRSDINKILEAVRFYQQELIDKWEEYYGKN